MTSQPNAGFSLCISQKYCSFALKSYSMAQFAVTSDKELVTPMAQTRAGFIEAALAKNEKASHILNKLKLYVIMQKLLVLLKS